MYCFTTDVAGARVVHVGGELDVTRSMKLRETLGPAITPNANVVLDLSAVTRVDSAAVGILAGAKRRADICRARLTVTNTPVELQPMLAEAL